MSVACLFAALLLALGARAATPAAALYCGSDIPLEEFGAFDLTVIDPDHVDAVGALQRNLPLYAYVSVGEVQPWRGYYGAIPEAWKLARNADWRSEIIDQSATDWPAFLAERVVQPLWDQGFRGFLLGTLDSYRLVPGFDEEAQRQGLVRVRVIETLHQRFAGMELILTRGFDILPQVRGKVQMVAAESLYQRWNARARRYEKVPEADRLWLQERVARGHEPAGDHGLSQAGR